MDGSISTWAALVAAVSREHAAVADITFVDTIFTYTTSSGRSFAMRGWSATPSMAFSAISTP